MMRYVVGCMGQDGELGRTFLCTYKEVESAVLILVSDNQEPDFNDIVDDLTLRDHSTSEGVAGTYFVGGLENL